MKRNGRMSICFTLLVFLLISGCGANNGDNNAGETPGDPQQETEQPADDAPAEEETPADEGTTEVDVEAARQSYEQNCLMCHGQNLEGGNGPQLNDVGARYSEEGILEILENGKGAGMPGGLVSEEEAKNLAAWLATMK